MKFRSVLTLIFTMFFASAAFSQSTFFDRSIGNWNVFGKPKVEELNPSCNGEQKYQDGSFFSIIRDLADGEIYILFHNVTWNITDNPGNYQMRINFYRGSAVTSLVAVYELLNKNTLRIRAINPERFLPPFVEFSRMVFIMPGNIQNAEVNLRNSSSVIAAMSECVRQYTPPRPGMNL